LPKGEVVNGERIECRAIPVPPQQLVIQRITRIILFAGFTAVGAQLAVPLPFTPVPLTLQTLFVVMAGIMLGPRDGFYAMASYIGMGLLGAPIFAGFTFGPAILFGPTGGYLVAFPAAALVAGSLARSVRGGRFGLFVSALSGSALILLSGTLYLSLVTRTPLASAAVAGALPFAAGEAIKAAVAAGIASRR
jgi:biotin transport system substrate-specific component